MTKNNNPSFSLTTPVAILIGCTMISISVLVSGGVIRLKPKSNVTSSSNNQVTTGAQSNVEKLTEIAGSLGLNKNQFKSCMESRKYEQEVNKDLADANAAGQTGTPTFYIGKSNPDGNIEGVLIEGAYPFARFKEVFDALLAGQQIPKIKTQDPNTKQTIEIDNRVARVSVDDDPVLGDKNAPVTMIEFSDYECPFCQRHFRQTLPQIKSEYIDTGKVKLIYRDLIVIPTHNPWATDAAMAGNCAREQGGDEAYFKFHDAYYTRTKANGQGV